jgi:acyl-CoA thioesterase
MSAPAEVDDATHLARRCADAMWDEDVASQRLGMRVDAVGPGTASVSMKVTDRMINGHGLCHGGLIFTLADTAFAFACNTYNQRTVAQQGAITFLAPARHGDLLTARAREQARVGRNGVYDVRVISQDGTVIAEFRGNSRTLAGRLVDDDQEPPTA